MSAGPDYKSKIAEAAAQFEAACGSGPAGDGAASVPAGRRPLQVDLALYGGSQYLAEYPSRYDWLLDGSLRRGVLGAVVAAPGAGKSTAAAQLCAAVGAGGWWLGAWKVTAPGRVLYLSAEDDFLTVHRRIHHALKALPENLQDTAAANIFAVPVSGDVALCRGAAGIVSKTEALDDLRGLLVTCKPDVLILDTLARFVPVPENDNPAMTAACALLEGLCHDFACAILLLHHTAKGAGALAGDEVGLDAALEQTASRGASALAGCVRWQMNLAPISKKLSVKIIGDEANGKADGSFLAARVSKKNCGAPERKHFLTRGEHGLLRHIEVQAQERETQSLEQDVVALVAEVRRRADEGLEPLSYSRGGRDVFGWGYDRSQRAVFAAVDAGEIVKLKKERGKGEVLTIREMPGTELPKMPELPELPGKGENSNDINIF